MTLPPINRVEASTSESPSDNKLKAPLPVQRRLGNQPLTSFYQAARSLVTINPPLFEDAIGQSKFASNLFAGLSDIATKLETVHPALCKLPFFLDLAARVWHQTEVEDEEYDTHLASAIEYLTGLGAWLGRDGFDNLQDGQNLSRQILDIYQKVLSNIPKNVFIVRWYASDATQEQKKRADLRFDQVSDALRQLKEEDGIRFHIIDLATNTGGTELIHPRMYSDLASSDIVIVDLTGASPNVYIETGFALGRDKKKHTLLLFNQIKPDDKVPFDLTSYRYEPFQDTAEIPALIKRHIKEIMREAGMNISQ